MAHDDRDSPTMPPGAADADAEAYAERLARDLQYTRERTRVRGSGLLRAIALAWYGSKREDEKT